MYVHTRGLLFPGPTGNSEGISPVGCFQSSIAQQNDLVSEAPPLVFDADRVDRGQPVALRAARGEWSSKNSSNDSLSDTLSRAVGRSAHMLQRALRNCCLGNASARAEQSAGAGKPFPSITRVIILLLSCRGTRLHAARSLNSLLPSHRSRGRSAVLHTPRKMGMPVLCLRALRWIGRRMDPQQGFCNRSCPVRNQCPRRLPAAL